MHYRLGQYDQDYALETVYIAEILYVSADFQSAKA